MIMFDRYLKLFCYCLVVIGHEGKFEIDLICAIIIFIAYWYVTFYVLEIIPSTTNVFYGVVN